MPTWLVLAKGPIFRFVFAIMVFGLLRLALLTSWEMALAIHRAGDRRIPYLQILRQTFSWLIPVRQLHRSRAGYSLASFMFHLSILIAALFLGNHLDILAANFGISWFSLPKPVLDILTLAGILGGSYILLFRIYVVSSRQLSGLADYLLLVMLLNIFVSGFVAGKPWNPIPYDGLMLFHTVNGLLLMLLAPFTKIAHCALFPLIRLGSEIAWRLVPMGGSRVVESLHGPEGRKI